VTAPAFVCAIWSGGTVDQPYPSLFLQHPRNRGVDWAALWHYAQHGTPTAPAPFELFIKASFDIDVAWLSSGVGGFAVSDRLRAVLEPVSRWPLDFLPITVNGRPFWILRVLQVVDALDLAESTVSYLSTGTISSLDHPIWIAERIPDPCLFRVPAQPNTQWATSGVAAAYEASGCHGLTFWPLGGFSQRPERS
jgi:hypothetical protein